jgi:hypothetical protein
VSLGGRVCSADGESLRAYVFLEKLGKAAGFAAGIRCDREGSYSFKGMEKGSYRIVVLKRGYGAFNSGVDLASSRSLDVTLSPSSRLPDPKTKTHSYAERKNLLVGIDAEDFSIQELAWWLSELADARISVDEALIESSKNSEEAILLQAINIQVGALPLKELIRLVTSFRNLGFDEDSGRFIPK